MNFEDMEKLKIEHKKLIDSVRQELADLKAQMKPFVADKAFGRTGTSDAMQKRSFQQARVETLEYKLRKLEQVLDDIDSGKFGICENCGEPIGEERIKALPETKRCIRCAQ